MFVCADDVILCSVLVQQLLVVHVFSHSARDYLSVRPHSVYCDSLTANTYRHLCGRREQADLTAAKNTFHLLVGVVDELW